MMIPVIGKALLGKQSCCLFKTFYFDCKTHGNINQWSNNDHCLSRIKIFSGKKKYSVIMHPHIQYIDEYMVKQVSVVKFLEVLVDNKICRKSRIDHTHTHTRIWNKAIKSLGIAKKINNFPNKPCLLTLYYTLIYPYLSYCNAVWGSNYHTSLLNLFISNDFIIFF